jgi:hypothetical protein
MRSKWAISVTDIAKLVNLFVKSRRLQFDDYGLWYFEHL